jgi:outer membrane lipoprotein-sorting protein
LEGGTVKRTWVLLVILFLVGTVNSAQAEPFDFDGLLKRSLEAYGGVNDFICRFNKKELVRASIHEERNILFKYRKPGSFYMKLLEGKNKDMELLFVEGKYDNELQVHTGGFLGFLRLGINPRGYLAMRDNRHPMMDAGIGHFLDLIMENYRKSKNDPESRISFEGETLFDGRMCLHIKAVFPNGKGYYGHTIHVYFDRLTTLPVKLTVLGWNNEFLEEYSFEGLKLNTGLTDRDFDIKNPEYRF